MRSRQSDFIAALKWPALMAAVLVAAALGAASRASTPEPASAPGSREAASVSRVDMRDAMRILRDGARPGSRSGRPPARGKPSRRPPRTRMPSSRRAKSAARGRTGSGKETRRATRRRTALRATSCRATRRGGEARRRSDAGKQLPKPKPEPVAAGAPLDIVPAPGEAAALQKPRGPIETVVAKVGGVADEIKNKTVSTVTGIKDWFSAAGDKLLGRDKSARASAAIPREAWPSMRRL